MIYDEKPACETQTGADGDTGKALALEAIHPSISFPCLSVISLEPANIEHCVGAFPLQRPFAWHFRTCAAAG